jgi:DNA repair protein RecN (Recombination protein N)
VLTRLFIQNYALIKELDLHLEQGFTAITGETGSGKSILLGALGIALGERADTHILFDKEVKCIVEAEFELKGMGLQTFFKEADIDHLERSTFRREINTSGRSRAFVNDTPVSLQTLKGLAQQLVDVHSQHQTLLLRDEDFQLQLLDLFAQHGSTLPEYQTTFESYRSKQVTLSNLKRSIRSAGIDKDYLQFQLDELSELDLTPGEDERVREELGLLEHADEIRTVLSQAIARLQDESGLLDQLNSLSHEIDGIAGHTKGLEELAQRIDSTRLELDDIARSIEDIESNVESDPEKKEILAEQVDAYQRLMSKHRVADMSELIALKQDIESRLIKADSARQELDTLEQEIAALEDRLKGLAEHLTAHRKEAIPRFIQTVSKELKGLSLTNGRVDISISQLTDYQIHGFDEVNILFSANKGGQLEVLHKVASGGELSRLMLILKQQMAKIKGLPTLIFDEIDTGVSGEIASQMAEALRSLSKGRQVIAITHLPQVAGRAQHHLRISKSDTAERSITHVEALNDDGRILELAKMLSGKKVSEASVANAKELLKN